MKRVAREYLVTAFVCSTLGIRGLFTRRLWRLPRASEVSAERQYRIWAWFRTNVQVSEKTELGGHAADVRIPRPASLQGLSIRWMRTLAVRSAVHGTRLKKHSSGEEQVSHIFLFDEECAIGPG